MSVVALAMVLLDSHVSRRDTRTNATIVAERSRHRADGHIASTQFELQVQRVTNRGHAKRSRCDQAAASVRVLFKSMYGAAAMAARHGSRRKGNGPIRLRCAGLW